MTTEPLAVRCVDTNLLMYGLGQVGPEDLRGPARELTERALRTGRVVSPGFGWAEFGTALRKYVRAGLLPAARAERAWAHYWSLPIEFFDTPAMRARGWAMADQFRLPTLYDAAFLACTELAPAPAGAEREFWTADAHLLRQLGDARPDYVRELIRS